MPAAVGVLACVTLAGCTVGPDYDPPTAETLAVPDEYAGATTRPAEAVTPDVAWWTLFEDPLLVELVEDAARDNLDVEAALARLREARALRRVSRSGFFPTVDGSADYRRTRLSENGAGIGQAASGLPGVELEQDLWQAGFDASWELDVFGGVRRSVESADARTDATLESARDVLLATTAEVARNYAELRGAQARLDVARRNIDIQEQTVDLVERKRKADLVPEVEVAQARTQLETTKAALPPLRSAERAAAFRLSVLTGRAPAELLDQLLAARAVPTLPALPDAGVPADLLRRRPDLRQSERLLAAATADVGVATAELYPNFRLLGSFGLESVDLDDLLDAGSRTWSIGPGVTVPLFNAGRLRARVDAEQAQLDAAFAEYRQSVLLALEEVEGSLVRRTEAEAEAAQLRRARDAARRSVELANVLYDRGLRDFQVVLDAQEALVTVEDRLAAAQANAVVEAVALYKALAGGWAVAEEAALLVADE